MSVRDMLRPGMRGYLLPLVAGLALAVSAFLPWVVVDGTALRGVPDPEALWIVGLGVVAALLAILSLITRKNSRHPLLVVGLVALGLMVLAWRILPKTMGERAETVAQAYAIVDDEPCQIVDIQKSKPGKHGSAKFRCSAISLFDGSKRGFVSPVDATIQIGRAHV